MLYYRNSTPIPLRKQHFVDAWKAFYKIAKIAPSTDVSLAIVDNATIQAFNRKYRKKNVPTDVLSFSEKDVPVAFPEYRNFLGEIIISADMARIQAKKARHRLHREIQKLFIHGLAHLIGYDHHRKREAEEMETFERQVFQKVQK